MLPILSIIIIAPSTTAATSSTSSSSTPAPASAAGLQCQHAAAGVDARRKRRCVAALSLHLHLQRCKLLILAAQHLAQPLMNRHVLVGCQVAALRCCVGPRLEGAALQDKQHAAHTRTAGQKHDQRGLRLLALAYRIGMRSNQAVLGSHPFFVSPSGPGAACPRKLVVVLLAHWHLLLLLQSQHWKVLQLQRPFASVTSALY
jgi:hypothetical protein